MAKLPKYICMKVRVEDGLTVCLDPVDPEEVAADVRPVVRGHWIAEIDGEIVPLDSDGCPGRSCHCSVCGDWLDASDEYAVKGRFCPNCGADMRPAPEPPKREEGAEG